MWEQLAKRDACTCFLTACIACCKDCKWRACSQAKNKFKCLPTVFISYPDLTLFYTENTMGDLGTRLPTVLEMIFYLELRVRLYFDCTSTMVFMMVGC